MIAANRFTDSRVCIYPGSALSGFAEHLGALIINSHQWTEQLWDRMALELFQLQFDSNPVLQGLAKSRNVRPENLERWTEIPPVPIGIFRECQVSSIQAEARSAVFYSSGTSSEFRSRHFHCADSLRIYETSAIAWYRVHFPGSWQRMVFLTPPPALAPNSSLIHMFEAISRGAGSINSFMGNLDRNGGWSLDYEGTTEVLLQAQEEGQAVLVLGTAFLLVQFLDYLRSRATRLALPPGSAVFETGGYKGVTRELPKARLHDLICRQLAISGAAIISEYGMCELSSQAYDGVAGQPSSERKFAFPPWVRFRVVSPEDGLEVGEGKPGLIQVFDLANVYSAMAIQTEDIGIRQGLRLELVGRARAAIPRGCSLMTTMADRS